MLFDQILPVVAGPRLHRQSPASTPAPSGVASASMGQIRPLQRGEPGDPGRCNRRSHRTDTARWGAGGCSTVDCSSGQISRRFLDRPRLDEQLVHVAGEQVSVRGMDQRAPETPFSGSRELRRLLKRVPRIALLPHRVVQPAHVPLVPDGETGAAQRNHLIDRLVAGARPTSVIHVAKYAEA